MISLDPQSVEAVAQRVAELLRDEPPHGDHLLTADDVAARLGVSRDYVYRHADELGGKRLGDGPKAPLRFDPAAVEAYASDTPSDKVRARPTHRKRPATVDLLPIRETRSRRDQNER